MAAASQVDAGRVRDGFDLSLATSGLLTATMVRRALTSGKTMPKGLAALGAASGAFFAQKRMELR